MRLLLALLVVGYLVGIGVTLAPTIKAHWNTVPMPEFVGSVGAELPSALAWPATAYRRLADNTDADKPTAPETQSSAQ